MSDAKSRKKLLKSFKRFLASDLRNTILTVHSHPTGFSGKVTVYAETKNMLIYKQTREGIVTYKMLSKDGTMEVVLGGQRLRFSAVYLRGLPRSRRKRRLKLW